MRRRIVGIETVGKMTDRQSAAKVRKQSGRSIHATPPCQVKVRLGDF